MGGKGHLIENYKLQSVMLACRHFTGSHNAEIIFANYQDIMLVNKTAHNDELMNQAVLPSQVEMADKIY